MRSTKLRIWHIENREVEFTLEEDGGGGGIAGYTIWTATAQASDLEQFLRVTRQEIEP